MQYFLNSEVSVIISDIIREIRLNKDYLTRIDGEIGDGDHGINMNKGFTMASELINDTHNFSDSAKILSHVLMMEIGGSMGPLYGTFFKNFFRETKEKEKITAPVFLCMLESSLKGVREMGLAEVGDKTMIDALAPAVKGFKESTGKGLDFCESLLNCVEAARVGRDSTKDMIARIGRSARLGERSRGVLDAGAVSCFIILESISKSVISILKTDK
jgi:phosphoenolpyruvate---glycerone phosphotransferase subunit DhaL